ncbi:MAG: hypothetical protein LDL33_11395 [Desulfomonile sp.]|nr:hypothetical protein [Desulfomonile sp.]
MKNGTAAERIVRDIERTAPYMFEGLYGSFLRNYMESDRSKWTRDLSRYLTTMNTEWEGVSREIADLLWEKFEKRISC